MSTTAAADLTPAELDHLALWGSANRLEVAVRPTSSGLADDAAYIGMGFGLTSWTVQRCSGRLWLSMVGDRAGRRCTGWTMAVNSVEEATSRIAGMLANGWR